MRSKILVASGDDSIRRLIATCLNQAGHETAVAANGAAVLAQLSKPDCDVALVILDGQFPPISGSQVLRTLRAAGINLPVILASGSFIFDDFPTTGALALLSKPFDLQELVGLVHSMLGAGAQSKKT